MSVNYYNTKSKHQPFVAQLPDGGVSVADLLLLVRVEKDGSVLIIQVDVEEEPVA